MTVRGKHGKPKAGFPPFPLPLEITQNQRDSHIPTATATTSYIRVQNQNTELKPKPMGWAKLNFRNGPGTVAKRTTRAHLVNGGDAQSLAYRSGDNAPNTDPAPPGIPHEDGGVVPTDMSPSDPQSSARRCEGEAQYTIPDRPAIPTEQGDAAPPDSMSPGDAQYAAHWSGGTRSSQPFPGKVAMQSPIVCHGAIRNLLRIGPSATRQILSSLPFSVETPALYRTPSTPAMRARTS
jgi:hypothetical protein